MSAEPSANAKRVLAALAADKCVIVKGVPASGKSLLLGEVRRLFEGGGEGVVAISTPLRPSWRRACSSSRWAASMSCNGTMPSPWKRSGAARTISASVKNR